MKVTINFDLPEEEEELNHALMGSQYHSALFDFYQNTLRRRVKYDDTMSEKTQEVLQTIVDEFFEELNSREIKI